MRTKQKKIGAKQSAGKALQVMTVSLFIILLAFFIMLNAIAVIDESKKMKALGSLLGSFGILPGGLSVFTSKGKDMVPPTAPMKKRQFDTDVTSSLPDQNDIDMLSIKSDDQKDIVTIQEELLFEKGGIKIKQSVVPLLNKLCRIINRDNSGVEIAGHTDNTAEHDNAVGWKLSGLQAIAVARYFIEKGKVDPKSVIAYGCSEYRPRITNVTKETRKQNRRVDIIINPNARRHLSQFYKRKPNRFFTFKKFVFDLFD